jgi:hypothetical protein
VSDLLSRLLVQDVKRTPSGKPEIIQGVAPDRIVSVHDPEMRHGRKSATQRFNGFKAAVAVDTDTQLFIAVDVIPANAHDSHNSAQLITQSEDATGSSVETVLGDTAYGSIEQRLSAENKYTLVAPVARPPQTGRFTKDEFVIDLDNQTVTCPAGKMATHSYRRKEKTKHGRIFAHKKFFFAVSDCAECSLRKRCIADTVTQRSINVHEHEALLRAAKHFQTTDAFRALYRVRCVVEHRIARLAQLDARKARYFGNAKVLFQLAITAAVANLTLIAATSSVSTAFLFVSVLTAIIGYVWLTSGAATHLIHTIGLSNAIPALKRRGLQPDF